ncbi:MAG: ATP-binding protein [Litorimonas sp.]
MSGTQPNNAKPHLAKFGTKSFIDRRQGPRRNLLSSRLTRNIFLSNMIGLLILVIGSLAVNRFEQGLIDAKVENLRSLAATMTTYVGEQATGFSGAAELDIVGARQVLRGANVPETWRVRLHDRSGQVVVDTATLDDTISVSALDPIITEDTPAPTPPSIGARFETWLEKITHNLPWRKTQRDTLRRDLRADIRQALMGETVKGPRYDEDDMLIVTVSVPVQRVQQVLGVITVEANDVSVTVNAARSALSPIIGLAFLAAILSSLALTLFITLPMRKLARAAEIVTRSSKKRDAIPDLSHRRDEIGDLSSVMRDMTQGLYSRIDDIANFAADVAHEIKNPLTSLRSASDTLRVAKTAEQRAKLIDIIQQDVSRMDRLISDISKASKVDANLARETAQSLDVADILHNITEFYQQTHEQDGPQVMNQTMLDASDPVFIRAFETPFAQVLRNLIDNALTFSPKDGTVRVKGFVEDGSVIITVEDDGPGIPQVNLDTVFDRFYTQRPKGSQFGSHSGLGLTICRQIMTAHNGAIEAQNNINASGDVKGARFIVKLPRQTKGGGPNEPKSRRKN